jgi:hypothetical protein
VVGERVAGAFEPEHRGRDVERGERRLKLVTKSGERGSELLGRDIQPLVGRSLAHGELRALATANRLFARRAALQLGKNLTQPVLLAADANGRRGDPVPIALVLLDVSPSGSVTRSVVFRFDSDAD